MKLANGELVGRDKPVSIVNPAHLDILDINPVTLAGGRAAADRAHDLVGTLLDSHGVHTTTETLLLLAALHADVDDAVGAEMLASFAATFADHEATVV